MRIEDLVKTLKKEYYKAKILQASLDAIVAFFIINLSFILLSISSIYRYSTLHIAILASLIIFVADSVYRFKHYEIELYEEENPELDEMLRTVRDNIENNTVVSKALFDDVLERTRSLSPATIISGQSILAKIVIILLLSFGTVLTGIMDFSLTDRGQEIIETYTEEFQDEPKEPTFEDLETGDPEDILGEPENIDPSDHEFDIDYDVQDGGIYRDSRTFESSENFISMFDAGSNLEQREIARQYMVEIREMESTQ